MSVRRPPFKLKVTPIIAVQNPQQTSVRAKKSLKDIFCGTPCIYTIPLEIARFWLVRYNFQCDQKIYILPIYIIKSWANLFSTSFTIGLVCMYSIYMSIQRIASSKGLSNEIKLWIKFLRLVLVGYLNLLKWRKTQKEKFH